MKHIYIVGGGFAGLRALRQLRNVPDIAVTLISDQPDFRYSPALWRTATGGKRRESSLPLQPLLEAAGNATFVQAKITKIDRETRKLTAEDGRVFHYDYCITALGVVTSYFGIPGLDTFSYSIKSAHEVERLKRHLHDQLTEDHLDDKTYVIVGAGPTGVELAAAFGQYLNMIAKQHGVRRKVSIELIEATDRVLPTLSKHASKIVQRKLEKLGVNVLLNSKVEAQTKQTLRVNGRSVPTHTVIWTAGVTNNPFFQENADQFVLDQRNRVQVNGSFMVDPRLFVIGDNVAVPFTGLALTAVRHATYVAKILPTILAGGEPSAYHHRAPITAIPVGSNSAVIEWHGFSFDGFIGGLVRRFADLIGYADIIGFSAAFALWTKHDEFEESCPICHAPRVTP